MISYAQIRTPRTQAQILAARIQDLQGVTPVFQTGPLGQGSGLGTGGVLAAGVAQLNASVVLRISASGEPGDGIASYALSLDGGVTFGSPTLITAQPVQIAASGTTFTFVAGTSGAGTSFVAGEFYLWTLATPVWDATAWQQFSAPRRLIDLETEGAAVQDQAISDYAAGGFLRDAQGPWLDLVASNVYNNTRAAAVFAQGWLLLSDTGGIGPLSIAPGSMWALDTSGVRRYVNLGAATLPLNGTVAVLFQAESPGVAWNVGNGGIVALVTPIPGVTVLNTYYLSPIVPNRVGAPTVVASGTPNGSYSIQAQITSGGALGAALARYSLDGGDTWSTPATIPGGGAVTLGASGVTLTFGSGTYLTGDAFQMTASASWISQAGADVESDDRLRVRCQDAWPTLSQTSSTPAQALEGWALDASSQVTQALAQPDGTVPGQIDLYLAGPAGAVTADVVTAVDNACQPHVGVSDSLVTASATTTTVAVAGKVYVKAGTVATAQAAGLKALAEYQAACPIGGYDLGGGVTGASLDELIGCLTRGSADSPVTSSVGAAITAPTSDTAMTVPNALVISVSSLQWCEV